MEGSSSHRTSGSIDLSSFTYDEDERDSPGIDVLEKLDSYDLMELRKYFFENEKEEQQINADCSTKGNPLNRDEFIKSIDKIIGSNSYSVAAAKLFDELCKENIESKIPVVWWEQILDSIIDKAQILEAEKEPLKLIDDSNLQVNILPHCKREAIIKVVLLDTEESFCYVAISKYGFVGVYDGLLNLLENYKVHLGAQSHEGIRSLSTWINDAIAIPDASAILVAASDRTLHFLTATGLAHTPMFLISGLPNSPQCLSYSVGRGGEPSLLLFGDDHGNITAMRFHQPSVSLFRTTSSDRSNSYFWRELEGQEEWVTITTDYNVHNDVVRQIEYIEDNNTVISSSSDSNATVVIRHLAGRRAPYIFKLSRGVRCFHLDRGLKLLATGSTDNIVRLWNPVVTQTPIVSLYGHKSAVVDVRILKHHNSALSISRDGVLKVWDIEDHCCLQTVALNIPVFSVLGKMVEFGTKTLYPGPSMAKPPLARQPKTSPKTSLKTSHPASLTSNATPSTNPSITSEVDQWVRLQILLVCCNYAVLLPISSKCEHVELLPPPQRQRDPVVPSPWLRADAHIQIPSTPDISEHSQTSVPDPLEVISPRALQFLRRSTPDFKYQFKSITSPCHGLNVSRAQLRAEEKHMQSMVEQCAPHLALKLQQPEELKFSTALPMTKRMKNLDLTTPDKLTKAKLKDFHGQYQHHRNDQ